ncbi:MAG: ceramidase domain-containing protein [Woeseiaceae bacterium]|nr:ceramidase domain-containing protein [Woeseiaceae bacterium]
MLTTRNVTIAALLLIGAVFAVTGALPQDPAYHAFADTRRYLGVANFWNVVTNVAFLVTGAWGLRVALRLQDGAGRVAYLVFFAGLVLTALGSSWYHLAPDNLSLGWDRLAMTIAFAGLFPAVLAEYVSDRLARTMLAVMLVAGPASVAYWLWTESTGAGDLRPYAIVQFVPMLIILVILVAGKQRSDVSTAFYWLLAIYFAAKIFEAQDAPTLDLSGISGHSVKHLLAGVAAVPLVLALRRRTAGGPYL